jgi:hypothetical protein
MCPSCKGRAMPGSHKRRHVGHESCSSCMQVGPSQRLIGKETLIAHQATTMPISPSKRTPSATRIRYLLGTVSRSIASSQLPVDGQKRHVTSCRVRHSRGEESDSTDIHFVAYCSSRPLGASTLLKIMSRSLANKLLSRSPEYETPVMAVESALGWQLFGVLEPESPCSVYAFDVFELMRVAILNPWHL